MMIQLINQPKPQLLQTLWELDPMFKNIFSEGKATENLWKNDPNIQKETLISQIIESIRNKLFDYLNSLERSLYYIYLDSPLQNLHVLEKQLAKECLRVFKNIIRTENEQKTRASVVVVLYQLFENEKKYLKDVNEGFLLEIIYLLKGIHGQSGLFSPEKISTAKTQQKSGAENPQEIQTGMLEQEALNALKASQVFQSGLIDEIAQKRAKMKTKILKYYKAAEKDWNNPLWQLENSITSPKVLSSFIKLTPEETEALRLLLQAGQPFKITPYALSFLTASPKSNDELSLRALILPNLKKIQTLEKKKQPAEKKANHKTLDLPVRRVLPFSAELMLGQALLEKPFNSVARCWDLSGSNPGFKKASGLELALKWLKAHKEIREIVLSGGEFFTLNDDNILFLFKALAKIPHLIKIKIKTNVLSYLPQRITQTLLASLAKFQEPGLREITLISRFDLALQITSETTQAVKLLKQYGFNLHNFQRYNYYNSQRHEANYLRTTLQLCGIEPQFMLMQERKPGNDDFLLPVSRVIQEIKEEATPFSGFNQADEPAILLPTIGWSYLKNSQEHEPVMFLPDGSRIYRFYRWNTRLSLNSDYLYTDMPIYNYLKRLAEDQDQNLGAYESIWYYY